MKFHLEPCNHWYPKIAFCFERSAWSISFLLQTLELEILSNAILLFYVSLGKEFGVGEEGGWGVEWLPLHSIKFRSYTSHFNVAYASASGHSDRQYYGTRHRRLLSVITVSSLRFDQLVMPMTTMLHALVWLFNFGVCKFCSLLAWTYQKGLSL